MGFSIVGATHLVAITFILLIDGAKGVAGLGFFVIEFPLFVLHSHVFDSLFKREYYPQFNTVFFWIWIYIGGTVAWGVVGAIPGFVLGYLSGLKPSKLGKG